MKKVFGNIPTIPFIIFMILAFILLVLALSSYSIIGKVTSGLDLRYDTYYPNEVFEGEAKLVFTTKDLIPETSYVIFAVTNASYDIIQDLVLPLPLPEAIALSPEGKAGKGNYTYGLYMNNGNTTPFKGAKGWGFTACTGNSSFASTGFQPRPQITFAATKITGKQIFAPSITPDYFIIISKPDLVVQDVYLNANNIAYARIKNKGTVSSGKSCKLSISWYQTTTCPSQPPPEQAVQPGWPPAYVTAPIQEAKPAQAMMQMCTWTFTIDVLGAGAETTITIGSGLEGKTVTVTVDSAGEIAESNEMNNVWPGQLLPKPDLKIENAFIDETGIAYARVSNIGTAPTDPCELTISWTQSAPCTAQPSPGDDQLIDGGFPTFYTTVHLPGALAYLYQCTWTFPVPAFGYGFGAEANIRIGSGFESKTVTITVDSENVIAESDEDNNVWYGKLTSKECEIDADCVPKIMCFMMTGMDTPKCNPLTWKCYCGGICGDAVCDEYEAMSGTCPGDCVGCNDFDGKCVDARKTWYDYCHDDTHIVGYTCSGNDCVPGDPIYCGFGKVCKDGACIDETLLNASITLVQPEDNASFATSTTITIKWIPKHFDNPTPTCFPYAWAINASAQGEDVIFYPGYPSDPTLIKCTNSQPCTWTYQFTLPDNYLWGVLCDNNESFENPVISEEFRYFEVKGIAPTNYTCPWSNVYTINLTELSPEIKAPQEEGMYLFFVGLVYNKTTWFHTDEINFSVEMPYNESWVNITGWVPPTCPATRIQTKTWQEINRMGTANAMPQGCTLTKTPAPPGYFECVQKKSCTPLFPLGEEGLQRVGPWEPYPCEDIGNQWALFEYPNGTRLNQSRGYCCEENWTLVWGRCNATTGTQVGVWKDTNECDTTYTGPPTPTEQTQKCEPPTKALQKFMFWILIIVVALIIIILGTLYAKKRAKTKAARVIKEAAKPAAAAAPATLPKKEIEYPALRDYVKKAKARGMTKDKIRQELLKSGWPSNIIEKVLAA